MQLTDEQKEQYEQMKAEEAAKLEGEEELGPDNEEHEVEEEHLQTEGEQEQDEVDPSVEEEARAQGWRPLEEWNGPEDQWVDAETFVQRGREILPIVQGKYKNLEERYEKLQKDMKRLSKTNEAMLKRQQQYYLDELEKVREQAIEEGDVSRVKETDEKIKTFNEDMSEVEEPEEQEHPAISSFMQQNPWYGQDKAMTAYANAISSEIAQEYSHLSDEDKLNKLRDEVKKEFPHKFQPRRTKKKPAVAGASESARPRRKKPGTFDALPKEAKEACERQMRLIPGLTKEAYAKEYFAHNPEEAK